MAGTTLEELDARIQQLSSGDQLWLLERLAQHIRGKVNDVAGPVDEKSEHHTNGSASLLHRQLADQTTEYLEEGEELAEESGIFYLNPDSPLYQDLVEIRHEIKEGKFKLYTHAEVWGE